jgi:hypothetical protein
MIQWDIQAVYRTQGSGDPWTTVPGRHKTIETPTADIAAVNAMPHGDGAERASKNSAYKQALVDNLDSQGVAVVGWNTNQLAVLIAANDEASATANEVDIYITQVLGTTYPLQFRI